MLLAIPQIPLSLGNSILATRQIAEDLFPEKHIGVRKLSLTYAVMNLVNPWFGGVPTCHGSGGLAGHYTFGARTGGSLIIYGSLFLILGLFFATGFETTAVATAAVLLNDPPRNFSVLSAHKFIPPVMEIVAEMPDTRVEGFLAAGHAATITGSATRWPWRRWYGSATRS